MIVLLYHTLATKQRMLEGRNDAAIVFNLKTVSENTQGARSLWHSEAKSHGLDLYSTEAFPLCSKLLWLSQQSGNGGAGTVVSI